MKVLNFEELNNKIQSRRFQVEVEILKNRKERCFRRRVRDNEEIKVLNQISILRWQKAVQEGKIRYISKTEWYYDPS